MSREPVEWRIDAANSRWIRGCVYSWIGLFGGGMVLLFGLVLAYAVGAARAGSYGPPLVILLMLLVGGPFSLLYLLPAIRSGSFTPLSQFVLDPATDPDESLGERYARAFSWRVAAGSIGAHVVLLLALTIGEPRLLAGYVALQFLLLVVTSGFVAWGRIDPDVPAFEYGFKTVPLEAVKYTRRLSIGTVTCCWITYQDGAKTIAAPSWIVFTPDAVRAFETALENVEQSSVEPRSSSKLLSLLAGAIGIGFFGFAALLWMLADVDPGMALYVTGIFGSIGAFFVWIGLFHT